MIEPELSTEEPELLMEEEDNIEEPELLQEEEETQEPSYAYLLEKDKQRLCRKDLAYCTRDKDGKPVPFCFKNPDDKSCLYNTLSPNLLFLGCYDDATCGGKPVGNIWIGRSREY